MPFSPAIHIHVHGAVHVHLASDSDVAEIKQGLRTIDGKVDALHSRLETLMTQTFDTASNAIAARIDILVAKVNAGMSDAEVAQLKTEFTAERDRLVALGADPANPVPEPTPEPPVEPAPA